MARPAGLKEWIPVTISIGSHDHDDMWIGKVISRYLRKNQNVKCYNCGKQVYLKRDCRQHSWK